MTTQTFAGRLKTECAVASGSHILVAVSGGADSTALLCFFCEVRDMFPLQISCAHMEHGIRGESSVEDMRFVQDLCKKWNVPFYAAKADVPGYARSQGCGMEEAARILRYRFLRETKKKIGAHCIALAHHQMDQAETLLLHASRGCDMRGLCGMQARRGDLIRPLLEETPQSLRRALCERGIGWREDESNACDAYARNRIRRQALPVLESVNPGAQAALARLARAAQRDEAYFSSEIAARGLDRVIRLVDGVAIPKKLWANQHEALLSRALVSAMEKAGIEPQPARTLEKLFDVLYTGKKTAVNLTGNARAEAGETYLCLTRTDVQMEDTMLSQNGETQTPWGTFFVRSALPGETGDGVRSQTIPKALFCSAAAGMRREGDRMTPFGAHSPVKLKKLLEGIEGAMRKSVPVVRNGETILWLPGLRPAEACRSEHGGERLFVAFKGLNG